MSTCTGPCATLSDTGARQRSARPRRLSSLRNFLSRSAFGRLFRRERRESSHVAETPGTRHETSKVDGTCGMMMTPRNYAETTRKVVQPDLSTMSSSLTPVIAPGTPVTLVQTPGLSLAVSPSRSLKSSRAVLRAMVPSDASQSRRMDLLLLQETPTWDELTRSTWNGCSFANRARVWRLLVGYEPLKFTSREPTLLAKRARYRHFVQALRAPNGPIQLDSSFAMCTAVAHIPKVYDIEQEVVNDESTFGGEVSTDFRSQQLVPRIGKQKPRQQQLRRLESQRQSQHCKLQTSVRPTSETEIPSESPIEIQSSEVEYSGYSAKILRQIEMDLPRTHPRIPVFHIEQVRNPMRRILYIFGMLYPDINYVQGMNEILSAILVVFFAEQVKETDSFSIESFLRSTELNRMMSDQQFADAEADAFWTFSAIISAVEDNFTADQPGILRQIARLKHIVSSVEPVLWEHLAANGNDFMQFSFRWMNCLLMRELPFHLVVKLWDALLACPCGVGDFLVYFCAALLTRFTDDLLVLDFEQCMLFLQHLPTRKWTEDDIDELLSQAFIWKQSLPFDSLTG